MSGKSLHGIARISAVLAVLVLRAQDPDVSLEKKIDIASKEAYPVSLQYLDLLKQMADEKSFRYFGFESFPEVSLAEVGQRQECLAVFTVDLAQLRHYGDSGSGNPYSLLTGVDKMKCPVKVREQTRLYITTEKLRENWRFSAYGGTKLFERLAGLRSRTTPLIIYIPEMDLYFAAQPAGGDLTLMLLVDAPILNRGAGKKMSARRAFYKLFLAIR